jgi:hypothetical protein
MIPPDLLAVALPLAVCLVMGLLLDRALLGRPSCGWIERFGRGLMLGLGLVGSLSMLLDSVGIEISSQNLGALVSGTALALCFAIRSSPAREPIPEVARLSKLSSGQLALTVLLILIAAFGVAVAVRSGWIRQSFQFDAVTRWIFKAKVLHVDGTLLGPISTDPDFGFTHQRYPPLVCHIANLPALVLGRFNDRLATAMFPWFAVALVAVVYGAVRRRVGALTAALAAAWVGHLPLISYVMAPPPGAGAFAGMADIPMALFVTGTVLAAADAVEGKRDRAHLEAGLLLGFATLTKNEALPLVVVLALGLLISAPRARLRRALGVAGLAVLMYGLLWGRIAAGLPASDENYLAQLDLDAFLAGLERLQLVPIWLATQELIDFRAWNMTWFAIPVLLAAGRGLIRQPALRLLMVVIVLQFASYAFAYMITAWSSPAALEIARRPNPIPGLTDPTTDQQVVWFLMRLTMGRLLLHVAPLAICLALLASPLTPRRSG